MPGGPLASGRLVALGGPCLVSAGRLARAVLSLAAL
jgi:hypothetical protein